MVLFRRINLLLLFIIAIVHAGAQNTVRVTGKVLADDLHPLISATAYVVGFSTGSFTDSTGTFAMQVNPGPVEISFSYVGYDARKIAFTANRDTVMQIILQHSANLPDVTIIDKKGVHNISQTDEGVFVLRKADLQLMPAVLGELDPMRNLQMLPGVQSGNEGVTGIFIRGGSPDQNLLLLDGATVFNASHLYGFLSVFNVDAVQSVSLYKNSYPARYGGRLSSVIDIESNKGDTAKLKGSVSIGLITSHAHIEGPFKNRKTTFSVTARGCYVGLFTVPLSKLQLQKSGSSGSISYFFYDLNASLQHRFNAKNEIWLNFFMNDDRYKVDNVNAYNGPDETTRYELERRVKWRSIAASAGYLTRISARSSFTQKITFSNYNLVNTKKSTNTDTWTNGEWHNNQTQSTTAYTHEIGSKSEFEVKLDHNNVLRGGAEFTCRLFQTGKGSLYQNSSNYPEVNTTYQNILMPTYDMSGYAEYDYHPTRALNIYAGLRFNDYKVTGRNYIAILPRASVVFTPVKVFGMRASYANGNQNLHLLSSSQFDVNLDYWVPATAHIQPQSGWQASGGIFGKIAKIVEWSMDGFYKRMSNLVEFREGSNFESSGTGWENQIWNDGTGKAYGAEFFIAKKKGKFTAQASYTLAWSLRRFSELNNGQLYPYKYDRRHDVALMAGYDINKHWNVGSSWIYGSGNMYSMPAQFYDSWATNSYTDYLAQTNPSAPVKPIEVITAYSGKNSYRLPAYHHLDVYFNYKLQKGKLEHQLNVTIYNVYSRQNIFSIYTQTQFDADGTPHLHLKQLSLFPVLPSVTYTINFNS